MKEFNEEVEKLNEDPVFVSRITPEQDEEFIRNSELYYAKKEGIEENKIEIAKNLLKMNMPVEDIVKATNLTQEQIENLK